MYACIINNIDLFQGVKLYLFLNFHSFVSPWEQSQLFEFICWVCKKYSSQKQMLIDLVKLKPDPARWFLEMTESLEKFCDDCFLKSDSKELLPSILLEIMVCRSLLSHMSVENVISL